MKLFPNSIYVTLTLQDTCKYNRNKYSVFYFLLKTLQVQREFICHFLINITFTYDSDHCGIFLLLLISD